MSELFKILQPLQFIQTFLKTGTRPDGRKFDETREVLKCSDVITKSNGSSMVKFGTSTVICGITTSLAKPSVQKPDQGIVEIDVNICVTEFDHPDRIAAAGYIRECLRKILFHAKVLNLEQLCLIPRKHCWKISIKISCISTNGSIVDLSLMAVLVALNKCKLPKYDIDLDFDRLIPTDQIEPIQIRSYPILSTFVTISGSLLVDPDKNEEELSDSLIRIAVESSNDSGDIYLMEITGKEELDETLLRNIYDKAMKRAKFLKTILDRDDAPIKFEKMSSIGEK